MATYDFYKYFDNVNVDVTELNKKYGIVYPNSQPTNFDLKNLFFQISLPEFTEIERYFEDYIITENERPDQIAYKLYEDVNLWWINLVINKISYFDFPINDDQLYTLAGYLYENEYKFTLEKYIDILKNINESKRNIKVIKPEHINIFLSNIFNNYFIE